MTLSHKQAQLLISLLVILLLIFFYHPILFAPNSYMFSTGSDGLANYFTFAYHLQAKGEILNSSVMNYPFGESIFYIDMMPGIVNLIALLKPLFPNIANYSVGIINYLIFISWLFSALFLFELYRFCRIPMFGAIMASVSVVFLSPQIDRIFFGHYALALTVFIPWILWLCLRFFEQKRKMAGLSIFLLNLWTLFIHAYLGILTAFISIFFAIFYIEKKHILKSLSKTLIALAPIFIYFIINKLFDNHSMREVHTWGYFFFNSNIKSFFIPRNGVLHNYFNVFAKQSPEGDAYIGIFASLTILLLAFYGIKKIITNKTIPKKESLLDSKFLHTILFIGIIGGCIAMSFPFWFGLKRYFSFFPLINQFRSIGRFAWIFYYCINILAPAVVYNFLKKIFVKKQISIIIFAGLLLIPCAEALIKQIRIKERYNFSQNCLNKKYLYKEETHILDQIETDKYQAIIPIPYFHSGSNCYFKMENTHKIIRLNDIVSFYKEIPSFGVRLSRTSLLDTRIIGSIFLPPYCERAIGNYMLSEKPCLILRDKTKSLLFYEKELIKQADLYYEDDAIALYNLYPELLKKIDTQYFTSHSNLVAPTFYENFSNHDNGVLTINSWKHHTIFDSRNAIIEPDSLYRLSFWTYIGEDDRTFKNEVIFLSFNANDELIEKKAIKTGCEMLMYNDWGRIDYLFSISKNQYLIANVSCAKTLSIFDDVMLQKESENTVIENDCGEVLFNNFKLFKNK